jgi:hypothetical protein
MVVIFRAGCPVNPYAATRVMSENRRPFPDGGNTVIKMGFPAHWRVHIVGDLEPFTLEVMARGDYGKSWDSLRVRVTFDDWTPPAAPRRSIPVQVRRSIREAGFASRSGDAPGRRSARAAGSSRRFGSLLARR